MGATEPAPDRLGMTPSQHPWFARHGSVWVARDDLLPGGTKSRFLPELMAGATEVVSYGYPESGGALAVAVSAWQVTGSVPRVLLLYPGRRFRSPRQREAERMGARIELVRQGTLSTLRERAAAYCVETGARLIEWGMPELEDAIREWAKGVSLPLGVSEVWLAAGSGTLMRAFGAAWPHLQIVGVQVGKPVAPGPLNCRVVSHPLRFEQETATLPPFPSCRTFGAKAWEVLQRAEQRSPGPCRLFWNVMRAHL